MMGLEGCRSTGSSHLPIDILRWSLDVAGLAVDATGRVGLVSSRYLS